ESCPTAKLRYSYRTFPEAHHMLRAVKRRRGPSEGGAKTIRRWARPEFGRWERCTGLRVPYRHNKFAHRGRVAKGFAKGGDETGERSKPRCYRQHSDHPRREVGRQLR